MDPLELMRQDLNMSNPDEPSQQRGVLYPSDLPQFCRVPATGALQPWVRWWWAAEWDLPEGAVSSQQVLSHPTTNLVVENSAVVFSGPTTRASTKTLAGRGWAVGAALKPAALDNVLELDGMPSALAETVDQQITLPGLPPRSNISAAMSPPDTGSETDNATFGQRVERAIAAYGEWICAAWQPPSAAGVLATQLVETSAGATNSHSVADVAVQVGTSVRTLQRVAATHIGLTPQVILNRARVQDVATRLRETPEASIASIACELGYSDHAHLTRDFRRHVGQSPQSYRETARPRAAD